MALLVVLLLLAATASALFLGHWWQREQAERLHDRARLQVIEGQLATLRAVLRIGLAEQRARRQMRPGTGARE